jgi:hypothetical protein
MAPLRADLDKELEGTLRGGSATRDRKADGFGIPGA